MRYLLALALSCGLAAVAQAQENDGIYVGVSLGLLSYEEINRDFGVRIADDTAAYRLLGGYQFNDYYAIEVGLGTAGDIEETLFGASASFGEQSLRVRGEYEIMTVRGMAMAPVSPMHMYGAAGYYESTLSTSIRYEDDRGVFADDFDTTDSGFTVAGGIIFDMDRVSIRGEYEWFDTDDDVEATSLNVSVLFRF